MTPFEFTFANRLAAKIEEQNKLKTGHVRTGTLTDPDYRRTAGYLAALDDVMTWCQQIQSDLNQGK